MTSLQVRARTYLEIALVNLSDLIALPDDEAAESLNTRMGALDQIHRIHERSYSERGIIAREFERRKLWEHLVDPMTEKPFPSFTAWMSCDDFLGCRRVNFESYGDMKQLEDVPAAKLIHVPKGNLKVLKLLSTSVRSQPDVLEAARGDHEKFMEKVEKEHPTQHLEVQKVMRFSPGRSWVKTIEEAISYALDHGIASSRDEALLRMAETSLNEWKLDEEISQMPVEELKEVE